MVSEEIALLSQNSANTWKRLFLQKECAERLGQVGVEVAGGHLGGGGGMLRTFSSTEHDTMTGGLPP